MDGVFKMLKDEQLNQEICMQQNHPSNLKEKLRHPQRSKYQDFSTSEHAMKRGP